MVSCFFTCDLHIVKKTDPVFILVTKFSSLAISYMYTKCILVTYSIIFLIFNLLLLLVFKDLFLSGLGDHAFNPSTCIASAGKTDLYEF